MIKYYILIFVLIGVITISVFPYMTALFSHIHTDFKSLLPRNYETVKRMDEMSALFGSMKNMQVVVKTSHIDKVKKILPALAAHIEAHPDVDRVIWQKLGYDFFNTRKLFFLKKNDLTDLRDRIDRRIQREKLGDLYISFDDDGDKKEGFADLKDKYSRTYTMRVRSPYYVDEKNTVIGFAVEPKGEGYNISRFKKFGNEIKQRISDFNIQQYDNSAQLFYTGGVINSVHEYDSLMSDLRVAGIFSGIVILILILFYFRNIRSIFFVSIPLACGLIWNFALTYFTVGHLNMTTAFLFSILFGLGIDFGIHLNARYNEERATNKTLLEAIGIMIRHTGRSSLTAGLTTSMAFLVLTINDFKGFSEFGWIAGIGILLTFLAYIIILPALFTLEDRISFLRRNHFRLAGWQLHLIGHMPTHSVLKISVIALTLCLLSGVFFTQFNYDFTNFRSENYQIDKARELYARINPQKAVPSAILTHSRAASMEVRNTLDDYIKQNNDTFIHSVRNIYSLVPDMQAEKIPIMREIYTLLSDDIVEKMVSDDDKERIDDLKKSASASSFNYMDIPHDVKKSFFHQGINENKQLVYVFLEEGIDLKDGKKAMQLAEEITDIHAVSGNTYHAISSSIIFADVLRVMLNDSTMAILLSLIAVFLLIWLDLRNIKYTLLTLMPVLSGVVLMIGVMSLLNIDFNFFNMVVMPVVIGIGIDGGVHFFHRFQEKKYDHIGDIMTSTGGSIMMTTLTTMAGFSGMIFAHHHGLASVGITANIGLVACLIATVVIFPALLRYMWHLKE